MIKEVERLKGATDCPGEKDFWAEHLLGAPDVELPPKVDLNNVSSHYQGKTWHCTAYMVTHSLEIQNTIEHRLKALVDPEEQWSNQKYDKGNPEYMEKEGDSMQHAMQVLLTNGLYNKNKEIPVEKFKITGYTRVKDTIEAVKLRLAQGYPILTGSGNHCFVLTGYDDSTSSFSAKNSLKNDPFTVKYSDLGKLFSKYILFDKTDLQMIFKDVSENSPMAADIKAVRDLGIMTGYGVGDDPSQRFFKPEQPVTRAELAAVINRLHKKLSTK